MLGVITPSVACVYVVQISLPVNSCDAFSYPAFEFSSSYANYSEGGRAAVLQVPGHSLMEGA